jgi:hypothetical protein
MNRDNAFGVATGYGTGRQRAGVRVPVGSIVFSSPHRPDRLWGHPASYPMSTVGSFSGIKRQGREVDHSLPTSAEVKKMWIYTSIAPNAFMA